MVLFWCRRAAVLFVLMLLSAGLAPFALGQQATDQEAAEQEAEEQEAEEQKAKEEIISSNPLRPADTSSPRDTLQSFITSVNDAIQRWRANETQRAIRPAFERFAGALDLSQVPPSEIQKEAVLRGLMLKEILDRIDLPPFKDVPGKKEVEQTSLKRWTVPDTKITIVQLEEGPRAGEFLFSADTIDNLEEYYDLAKDLPYKQDVTVSIYEEFVRSPGRLIPRHWVLSLPGWMRATILDVTIWQWSALALSLVLGALAAYLMYLWGLRLDQKRRAAGDLLEFGQVLSAASYIAIIFLILRFAANGINLTGVAESVVRYALGVCLFGAIAWLAVTILNRTAEAIINARRFRPASIDSQLIRTSFRLLSILVVAFLVIYAAEFFGIPIAPLVAGLGVGGLAIALAVRPTLENVIGGLILFADKPVRVGDFCRYGDQVGTVEEIGLRSTRVRSLDRTIVSIPNAEFSQMQLDNFQKRDLILWKTKLELRRETTVEQLRYVVAKFREMLIAHPKVSPAPARVSFAGLGAYSLDLDVFVYMRTPDIDEYFRILEDVLFRMMRILDEAGTGFAVPTQVNWGPSTGLEADRARVVEAEVGTWRANGRFPFPEIGEEERRKVEDVLDYPPKGSPDHKP